MVRRRYILNRESRHPSRIFDNHGSFRSYSVDAICNVQCLQWNNEHISRIIVHHCRRFVLFGHEFMDHHRISTTMELRNSRNKILCPNRLRSVFAPSSHHYDYDHDLDIHLRQVGMGRRIIFVL